MRRGPNENGALGCRWDIEGFFKQLKQGLKLSCFLGRSANAVRCQVYAALLVNVLLRYMAQVNEGIERKDLDTFRHVMLLPRERLERSRGGLTDSRKPVSEEFCADLAARAVRGEAGA